ncbi:MAG: isoaspartyl peptidase/L-asparaginase, partial [Balneolaceae bacterium]
SGFGTVGAVALDRNGHLASATSTGGMTNKMYGRIGDVPIIGSGTYANSLVAISATGSGEEIMRHVSARTIASYMEFTESSLDEALDFMLDERLEAGDAGFIAVDIHGNISMKMNTESMFRAGGNSVEFRQVAIWEDDEENE